MNFERPLKKSRYHETVTDSLNRSQIDLSIVTPIFRKDKTLLTFMSNLRNTLDSTKLNYEVLAVVDGNEDGSFDILNELQKKWDNLKILCHQINMGKGASIKSGVIEASESTYLGYLDADLDIDTNNLRILLDTLNSNVELDFVYGSKIHPESEVNYPLIRKIMSFGMRFLIRLLFNMTVKDTQTGIKLGKTQKIRDSFLKVKNNRFNFDLELFILLKLQDLKVKDCPVKLNYNFDSTIRFLTIKEMFIEVFELRYRYRDILRNRQDATI